MQIMAIQSTMNNKSYRNNISNNISTAPQIKNNNPSFTGLETGGLFDMLKEANISQSVRNKIQRILEKEWADLPRYYRVHILFETDKISDKAFRVRISARHDMAFREVGLEDPYELRIEDGKGKLFNINNEQVRDYRENIDKFFLDRLKDFENRLKIDRDRR